VRAGVSHNVGDFPFYQANTLGGASNLRGYRNTRFAGRTSFYTNLEARVQLFHFTSRLAFGDVGLLGFVDSGRVWTDDESSRTWHTGLGGGIWTDLYGVVLPTLTVGYSEDGPTISAGVGFMF